jgi:hypothetical protein
VDAGRPEGSLFGFHRRESKEGQASNEASKSFYMPRAIKYFNFMKKLFAETKVESYKEISISDTKCGD